MAGVSHDNDAPLHSQIREHLREEIESGRFAPGAQIPTESELIARFDVSRTTVRRALHDLTTAGLIERHPGRGTFVREPRLEQELHRLTGFVEDAHAVGLQASARVVTIERVTAPRVVAQKLQLPLGEETVHIERVRLANRQPVSFDDSYFPVDLGERIAEEDLEVDPFYSILEDKYDIALGGADYVLGASSAGPRIAELLTFDEGSPVLLIERTSYAKADGSPILYEHLNYRGDRMRYRLSLKR